MAENIEELKKTLELYEQPGIAKLYYALNRKANEMADILNNTSLRTLDLSDAKDKTFERMKIIWNDATTISTAIAGLGISAGITGNEEKDTKTRKQITTPESIANQLGDNKAQDV